MKTSKRKNIIIALLLPSLIGVFLFYVLPIFMSFIISMLSSIAHPKFVGISNYIDVLNSQSFILALKNTVLFIFICVPLNVILSLFISIIIYHSSIKLHKLNLILLPTILPSASIILIWTFMLQNDGFFNSILVWFNLEQIDFLNGKMAFLTLILIYLWKYSGYNIFISLIGIGRINQNQIEAAYIDGASKSQTYLYVTLPMLGRTIFLSIVIALINSLRIFRESFLLVGEYPSRNIYMLQHFINNNFSNLNYQRLTSAANITLLVVVVMLIIIYWYYERLCKWID